MDGINPTLAFAALFFGLSGHPHGAAERPVESDHSSNWESSADPSDQPVGYLFDCPGAAVAVDDENVPIVPQDFDPLLDHQVALTGSVLTLNSDAAKKSSTLDEKPSAADELGRQIFQDQGGCDAR
jgi:hypothetical protein